MPICLHLNCIIRCYINWFLALGFAGLDSESGFAYLEQAINKSFRRDDYPLVSGYVPPSVWWGGWLQWAFPASTEDRVMCSLAISLPPSLLLHLDGNDGNGRQRDVQTGNIRLLPSPSLRQSTSCPSISLPQLLIYSNCFSQSKISFTFIWDSLWKTTVWIRNIF